MYAKIEVMDRMRIKEVFGRRELFCWCLVGLFLFLIIVIAVIFGTSLFSGGEADNKVPVMSIFLNDTDLETINNGEKNIKYDGNKLILAQDGEEIEYDDVEIKGRGNASWGMDKKSYRIKFDKRIDLLGLGRVKKWALISNGIDSSLLRNDLMHEIASLVYDNYNIRGDYVELHVDDENLGLYYLSKMPYVDKESVNLKDPLGILVEVDNAYCTGEEKWYRTINVGDCVVVKDVVNDDNKELAMEVFLEKYNDLEEAILVGDYEKILELADAESWAKYYLISDFASNPDISITSWYLYMDGEDDKIHAGLVWDFDAAFGNRNWSNLEESFYQPINIMSRMGYVFEKKEGYDGTGGDCMFEIDETTEDAKMISRTMCYLVDIPEFRSLIGEIYDDKLSPKRGIIGDYIMERAEYIRESALLNNLKWEAGDYDAEVKYLLWWIGERFEFMDSVYGKRAMMMRNLTRIF